MRVLLLILTMLIYYIWIVTYILTKNSISGSRHAKLSNAGTLSELTSNVKLIMRIDVTVCVKHSSLQAVLCTESRLVCSVSRLVPRRYLLTHLFVVLNELCHPNLDCFRFN